MNLTPLINLLTDNGVGVPGDTLFINMMPAEAENAILLRSPLQGTKFDYELPGRFVTDFQVIVRGHDYAVIETQMEIIMSLLTLKDGDAVESLTFSYCRPRTEPVAYPLSKGNLLEFNVWFDACYVKDAT